MADADTTSAPNPTSPRSLLKSPNVQSPALERVKGKVRIFEDPERPGKRQKLMPPLMTAAAAYAESAQQSPKKTPPPSTQTSPNPANQAVANLMGASQNDMSKAANTFHATNPTTTLSEPVAAVTEILQQTTAEDAGGESHVQTSPVSLSSIGTFEGMTTTVGSPLPMEETTRQPSSTAEAASASASPQNENKAMSYPAPFLTTQGNEGRRGMSLPHSATRQGTRSPSSKKHRCPYCATEFTRHHNLKSHLLTHSQEKPYVCSTCQSRFRRLHDLKRHTKLHTGERPHICPKCGRKFARGDALARHNKGPGGCAGRRASMGSFGGDDDYDEGEGMDDVMYGEPESLEDEEGNEKRPGIRKQAPSGDDTQDDNSHSSRIPSTYPPIQGRPPGGIASGHFPPRGGFGPPLGSGSSAGATHGSSMGYQQQSGSNSSRYPGGAIANNPLTESPKPLSPGQNQRGSGPVDARNRSPSMTSYPQSQYPSYPRSAGGSGSSLGVPVSSQLPPPPGFLPSQGAPTHPPTQPTGPPTHVGSGPLSSQSNSLSSHGHSGHGSGEATTSPMFAKEDRIWAYVKSLEQRMNGMQGEIDGLRVQLAAAQGQRMA